MIVGPLLMLGDFNTTKTVADTTSRPIASRMMVRMSRISNQGVADTTKKHVKVQKDNFYWDSKGI